MDNLEGQGFSGGGCLDIEAGVDCEFKYLSCASLRVGALNRAFVGRLQGIGVGLELSGRHELQALLLGLAAALEDGSRGKVLVEVVDEVEEVACVELESVDFPLAVQSGIQPPIGLHMLHDCLVETVELIALSSSVDPE